MIFVAAIYTDDNVTVVIQKLRGDKVHFYKVGDPNRKRVLTRKQFLDKYKLAR